MKPTLRALLDAGGTASNDDIRPRVVAILTLTPEQAAISHGRDDRRTEVEYRLAWARTKLKKAGLIESAGRSIWKLTPTGDQRARSAAS